MSEQICHNSEHLRIIEELLLPGERTEGVFDCTDLGHKDKEGQAELLAVTSRRLIRWQSLPEWAGGNHYESFPYSIVMMTKLDTKLREQEVPRGWRTAKASYLQLTIPIVPNARELEFKFYEAAQARQAHDLILVHLL